MLASITIGVTTFRRPASLARLEASLRKWYRGLPVIVVDTEGNLSAGRNQLVRQCQTGYLAILEDDFELIDGSSLDNLVAILDHDQSVGLAGGRLWQGGHWRDFAAHYHRDGETLCLAPPASPWLFTPRAVKYRTVDLVWNFFVARRAFLQRHPWDEDLPLYEHHPFFLGIWEDPAELQSVVFTPHACAKHHRDRPADYRPMRRRDFRHVLRGKYGFSRTAWRPKPQEVLA
jgi:hypothetical protein